MQTRWTDFFPKVPRRLCLSTTAALWALALLAGCAAPMGARRATFGTVYQQLDQSALNGPVPSAGTRSVLARHALIETFDSRPEEALATLHRIACGDPRQDTVFALAELNYLRATQLEDRLLQSRRRAAPDYYLCSAVYAYLYLTGADGAARPQGFDRRTRMACELYNRALAAAFVERTSSDGRLSFAPGVRALPPGAIHVTLSAPDRELAPENVETYLAADRLLVRGLDMRNRTSGIGAPLAVCTRGASTKRHVRWQPATAVLQVTGGLTDWSQGTLTAAVELHAPGDALELAGRSVPLEVDTTTPIAQALSNKQAWRLGKLQFRTGLEVLPTGIYTTEPYHPGRIPVIFVHGTMSSPVRWAEMWNTLSADPVLRERYQFWNFLYSSGNPLAASAARLREAIRDAVAEFDPQGKDPALQRLVLIGHSQGGLLARTVVTDSGDALWRIASDQDFDTLQMSAEQRTELRGVFFYTPLPCIKRVVFIATPHRGSYRASLLAQSLAQRFITLPGNVLRVSLHAATLPLRYLPGRSKTGVRPNSIIGMSPKNPYLLALAELPFPPEVRVHSIIAIKDDAQPPAGDDGVVTYRSAHLDQADSELVVRSKHSCQGKPATIEEVRRILTEHLREEAPQNVLP
jgi:pimeloyl-ACP methyl ester carboxylesterase